MRRRLMGRCRKMSHFVAPKKFPRRIADLPLHAERLLNLSIFTKGLILLTVILVFQLGFFGLIARTQWEYAETQRWASQSRRVIRDAQAVVPATTDADTGV